ncbi:MAG: hypothetical protein LBQ79_09760 [Deltaproteobacteria bacterium]|jgi:hypothetical protein|nr:hypothetical protein [Deltaproteobacteria bacterium]
MTMSRVSGRSRSAAVAVAIAAAATVLFAGTDAHGVGILKSRYSVMPFMTVSRTIPQVLIILSKGHKMYRRAYNDMLDLNGDGKIEMGFDPSITYYGYYDHQACYKHGISGDYFERYSWTVKEHEASNPTRPPELRDRPDIVIPKSANGVCPGAESYGGGTWHGNWLNWFMSSQMDNIRKALYGGKRSEDFPFLTVLEHSFVYRDGHVWAVQVAADDIWAEKMPAAVPYYDISLYTGFTKPAKGTYTFFSRTQTGDWKTGIPYMMGEINVKARHRVKGSAKDIGIWDYVASPSLQPDSNAMNYEHKGYNFRARVKVCDPNSPGGISPRENCREHINNAWKPSGIFQEYGIDNRITVGLMTGVADETWRKKGGIIRKHILSMGHNYEFVPGLKRSQSLLSYMDQINITGWNGKIFKDNTAWGTPLGEMLYESVRYFTGAKKATCTLHISDEISVFQFDWEKDRPKDIFSSDCVKPIVVIISPPYPDYDTDDIPERSGPEITSLNLVSSLTDPHGTVKSPFNKDVYLKSITALEGYGDGGKKYYYSRHTRDDCSPKELVSLSDIKGLCPEEPALEGGYSLAAVAWFARTHSLSPVEDSDVPMEVYALALPSTFPVLKFDLGQGRLVTVMPFSESKDDQLLPLISYFVVDYQTDSTGLPFYIKIVTAFDSIMEGGTFSRKALGTYEFALLTTNQNSNGSPDIQLEPKPLRIHAGELKDPFPDPGVNPFGKDAEPQRFYRFRNYAASNGELDYRLNKITIDRSKVIGFAVTTDAYGSISKDSQLVGYSITGTEADGSYMDVSHSGKNYNVTAVIDNENPWPNLSGIPAMFTASESLGTERSSPWSCLSPGGSGCGKSVADNMTYFMTRGFKIPPSGPTGQFLPDPLWLAAKYGGFNDVNHNGVPDDGEWEKDPGHPALGPMNYFAVENPLNLEKYFDEIFKDIARGQTFGTGTSSQILGDEGGGISIQTIFYPRFNVRKDIDRYVPFVGSVYALFLDRYGNLREDSDLDGKLTLQASNGKGDRIVTFTTMSMNQEIQPRCWSHLYYISLCDDPNGKNQPQMATGTKAHPDGPYGLKALWDAGRWLLEIDTPLGTKLTSGPRPWTAPATKRLGKRRIYFGYRDKSRQTVMLPFDLKSSRKQLEAMMLHENFKDYFPTKTTNKRVAVEEIVNWVIGKDYEYLRRRDLNSPWYQGVYSSWRLGDVMNSKPISVAVPASNFDILYSDTSYASFKKANLHRRIMVYFGANDGMLHAVNGGFAASLGDNVEYTTGSKDNPAALKHDLGAELWAFIPSAAMPTLPFLADPGYIHNFYVDLKPLLVDIKIRGEWKTVLVGGMRMGGRPIEAASGDENQNVPYFSDVFCFDVTDPEKEPKLMWTYSSIELGLMVGIPVTVRNGDKFYVMLPSGPVTDSVVSLSGSSYQLNYGGRTPYDGISRQEARIIVLDAETGKPVADPSKFPEYLKAPVPQSFFSSPFMPKGKPDGRGGWSDHVVYFGLTETSYHGEGHDGGSLWRVQMCDAFGDPLPPQDWKLTRMLDTGRPVTGAVNSTVDSEGSIWVVFGTGRLYGQDDVTPCETVPGKECMENHDQYLYGLKEPVNSRGVMTFDDLTDRAAGILDVSGSMVLKSGEVVNLQSRTGITTAGGMTSYSALENFLHGKGAAGWKRRIDSMYQKTGVPGRNFEMVITQPKFLAQGGGKALMAVTSFQPGLDPCSGSGEGFLHLVDAFTGLPRPETYSVFAPPEQNGLLPKGIVSGVARLGVGNPTEAIIIKTSGTTIVRATSSDGGVTDLEFMNTSGNSRAILLWREVTDTGFSLSRQMMVHGLSDN